MKTVNTSGTFGDAIAESGQQAKRLARAVRKLVSEICPDVVEVPWPRQRVVGYGVGPRKKTEHFCYIATYDTHVNLGFNYGLALPDPAGLLEGTGKAFRHVKIQSLEGITRQALRELIKSAINERKNALRK